MSTFCMNKNVIFVVIVVLIMGCFFGIVRFEIKNDMLGT